MDDVVVDASALVDLLLGDDLGRAVGQRLAGRVLHAPAHVDAEVFSALGRLSRAGTLDADAVETTLLRWSEAPIQRHPVAALMLGAWGRRDRLRLADALYVQLAHSLGLSLVTTDRRLGRTTAVDVITP